MTPVIRSHERIDFKRCETKWCWHWRQGLVPKAKDFGALELGTWMHSALAAWYTNRKQELPELFMFYAEDGIDQGKEDGAPEHLLEKAEQLAALGFSMAKGYQAHYGRDPHVRKVLAVEVPLDFEITYKGEVVAVHKIKPDMVYLGADRSVWLMEHKTATSIDTVHLTIDDQARPYGAMAERALRKQGIIPAKYEFKGMMYNFLRKGAPDNREHNAKGQALNKDGTVSRRQPAPNFLRHPVTMSSRAKAVALHRIQRECVSITLARQLLYTGKVTGDELMKTPHRSCARFCQFFGICEAQEQGTDITDMLRSLYDVHDPYAYGDDTTDTYVSFEMG